MTTSPASNSTGANLPFDLLIFDLGSTLIYFEGDTETYRKADQALAGFLDEAGISLDRERFLADFSKRMLAYLAERDTEFIEYTTAYILRNLLSEYGLEELPDDIIRSALKARYAVTQAYWKAELETIGVLTQLKDRGYRLAIISNAGDDNDVQELIDAAGVRHFFEAIITSAAAGIRKPNPRIFQMMLEKLDVPANRAAMVGDTLGADILGAQNAGIFAIWITRRADAAANRAHEDTIQPDAVIADLNELIGLLDALEASLGGPRTS